MFLYVIIFNCKMPMQVLFQIKFFQNRCLVTSWEHRHSPYCVHSFPSVWVISYYLEEMCLKMVI